MDQPGDHPEPPDGLAFRASLIAEIERVWFRIYPLGYQPLHFGRSQRHRFDAPDGKFGVLYLGGDEHCTFIETFGQSTGMNIVTAGSLTTRGIAKVYSSRPLPC